MPRISRLHICYVGVLEVTFPVPTAEVTLDLPGWLAPMTGKWVRVHASTDVAHTIRIDSITHAIDNRGETWIRVGGPDIKFNGGPAGVSVTYSLYDQWVEECP